LKHSDFQPGTKFVTGNGSRWRCTDIGRRTIVAIRLEPVELTTMKDGETSSRVLTQAKAEAEGWFLGPPYKVLESVFDEYDLEDCEPVVEHADDPFAAFHEWDSEADEKAFEILKQIEADMAETRRELRAFLETPPAGDPEFERQMAARRIMREDRDVLRQLAQADTMTSAEKIRLSGTATDRVQAEVWKALAALEHFDGSIMNVRGVYSDVHSERAALAAAREAIERAEKIMAEIRWPTDTDYDAV
jgi:hypothetical protein